MARKKRRAVLGSLAKEILRNYRSDKRRQMGWGTPAERRVASSLARERARTDIRYARKLYSAVGGTVFSKANRGPTVDKFGTTSFGKKSAFKKMTRGMRGEAVKAAWRTRKAKYGKSGRGAGKGKKGRKR